MKKVCSLFFGIVLALLAVQTLLAQAPGKIKYQAVLRDATGNIIPNTAVTVFVDILQGSSTGTSVYNESHSVTTTAQGVINLDIGGGTVNSGVFANINWPTYGFWVKVTLNGTVISTGQLMSVPYSLSTKGINVVPNGNVGIGTTNPSSLLHLYNTGPQPNVLVETNNTSLGPEIRLKSTATGGREWRIVSGASAANSYGAGSFELFDATAFLPRFGILPNGNIGIGTTTPTAKLEVAGTFKLVDGTQGTDKILKSDASGNASWVASSATKYPVTAVVSSGSYNWTSAAPIYTGTYITLPPGKWSCQISMLIPKNNDFGAVLWVRSTLTDGSGNSSPSSDIIGANLASGYKASNSYGMIIGTIIINNTSAGSKTYYYWGQTCEIISGSFNLQNFGTTSWFEDTIIAYPMN